MTKKRKKVHKDIKLLCKEKKTMNLISPENESIKLLEDEKERSRKAIELKDQELKEQKDILLRKIAESENSKRILKKETDMLIENANVKFLKEILPVVDNFDRAIASMLINDNKEQIVQGIKLVDKQFHQVLEKMGITTYKSEGEKFDPSKHEAISVIAKQGTQDGVVLEEHQKGYMFSGKVLRPAKVIVNKIDSENKEEIND